MRWSLFSLVALLVVLIVDVTALPIPQDDSEPILERRTKQKAPVAKPKAGSKKFKASDLKVHSTKYRKTASESTNSMLSKQASGDLVESKNAIIQPDMHAGTFWRSVLEGFT